MFINKGHVARVATRMKSSRGNPALQAVDASRTDYLFGLFGEYHLEYDNERQEGRDPSLTDMTEKAIEVTN